MERNRIETIALAVSRLTYVEMMELSERYAANAESVRDFSGAPFDPYSAKSWADFLSAWAVAIEEDFAERVEAHEAKYDQTEA